MNDYQNAGERKESEDDANEEVADERAGAHEDLGVKKREEKGQAVENHQNLGTQRIEVSIYFEREGPLSHNVEEEERSGHNHETALQTP